MNQSSVINYQSSSVNYQFPNCTQSYIYTDTQTHTVTETYTPTTTQTTPPQAPQRHQKQQTHNKHINTRPKTKAFYKGTGSRTQGESKKT